MLTITGTVAASGTYLVTGMPVNTKSHDLLKLTFENLTAGTNVALIATSPTPGTPPIRLSDSGGPGFIFLTIIDANLLSGMQISVVSEVGTAPSRFSLIVD